MQKQARDRFLTEVQGKCWHEPNPHNKDECLKCHFAFQRDNYEPHSCVEARPDYSTWATLGDLLSWAMNDALHSGVCKACGGRGYKLPGSPDLVKDRCPSCLGTGQWSVEVTCWECGGETTVFNCDYSRRTCPICHGSGRVRIGGWTWFEFCNQHKFPIWNLTYPDNVHPAFTFALPTDLINPDAFANAVAEFLRGRVVR